MLLTELENKVKQLKESLSRAEQKSETTVKENSKLKESLSLAERRIETTTEENSKLKESLSLAEGKVELTTEENSKLKGELLLLKQKSTMETKEVQTTTTTNENSGRLDAIQNEIEALKIDVRGLQSVTRQLYATGGTIQESETSSESMAYYHGSHAEHADPDSKLGIPFNSGASSTSSTVIQTE